MTCILYGQITLKKSNPITLFQDHVHPSLMCLMDKEWIPVIPFHTHVSQDSS